MLGLLERAGMRVVDHPAKANVVIVNTCAFIEPAVREAIEALLDAADACGPDSVLICSGCLAARYGRTLLTELPEVHGFVGPSGVERIVEVVSAALAGHRPFLTQPSTFVGSAHLPRCRIEPPWRATVKIADGCSHKCTFCTIPAIRGPFRSRPPEDIAAEVRTLLASGVVEINLVAQDTTAYGFDLGLREGLVRLIEQLGDMLDGVGWLRVQYMHPHTLTPAIVEAIVRTVPAVPYFDIPFQHAARDVLRSMGRMGDAETYEELVTSIRDICPDAAIRATFIVGFPEETPDHFEELVEFVDFTEPDHVTVFRYWAEEGTPAARLAQMVSDPAARERQRELLETARQVAQRRSQRLIGRTLEVLIEASPKPGTYIGRSFRDAPAVDGTFHLTAEDRLPMGCFVSARVHTADASDLHGRHVGNQV
jgi:ribosomal protein S12 methylthiotransferase